ncbi:MAG: C10 family peptidase, partial [Prevotella sp.]|nr:C10 family peptidase [Prevotella sp.]
AFVIDGYREGYFHINWGWGGQDAYVLMTSVDGWEELLLSQGAVFGIQPASGGSTSLSAVPDDGKTEVRWYDMGGRQREHPRKGLNITRMSNGTTKKILIR